ncbi:MAG: LacI family DNA-binding transcriptional regulator [Pseudomonadales bacterium]
MAVEKEGAFRKVTSVDVAKRAGVSRSAVSRTFTADASVSKHTREKVLRAAQELGYRVNKLASSLINNRSDLVGIVASNMDNPFRALQLESLSRQLTSKGLRPILLFVEGAEDPSQVIGMLLEYNVSGVIVTSDTPPQRICQECLALGVPMVLINKAESDVPVDRVLLDNERTGELALQQLHSAGARRMAIVTAAHPSYSLSVRIEAFSAQCEALGLAPVLHFEGELQNYEGGLSAAQQLLESEQAIEGVFCVSDYMALGFLDGLRLSERLQVPQDLKVISCDDIAQASWPIYDLTTIRQDTDKLAESVVQVLQERMANPECEVMVRVLEVDVIARGSTGLTETRER